MRQLHVARWGLVPSWAKDPGIGPKMINARSETVLEKPAFRKAVKSRRCAVPADGYYEWKQGAGKAKQPYYVHPGKGSGLVFAGLYEWWKDPSKADGRSRPVAALHLHPDGGHPAAGCRVHSVRQAHGTARPGAAAHGPGHDGVLA